MGKRRVQDEANSVEQLIEESTPSKKKRIGKAVELDGDQIENGVPTKLLNGNNTETVVPKKRGRPKKNSTVVKQTAKEAAAKEKKSTKATKKQQVIEDEEIDDDIEQPETERPDNQEQADNIIPKFDSDEDSQDEEEIEPELNKSTLKKFDFEQFANTSAKQQEESESSDEAEVEQTEPVVEKVVAKRGRPKKVKAVDEQAVKETKQARKTKQQPDEEIEEEQAKSPKASKKDKSTKKPSTSKKSKAVKETIEEPTEKKTTKQGRKTKQADISVDEANAKLDNKKSTKKPKANQKQTAEPPIIEEGIVDSTTGELEDSEENSEAIKQKAASSKSKASKQTMSKKSGSDSLRIISFNVNGVRSCAKKGLVDYLREEDADIVCLQELKGDEDEMPKNLKEFAEGLHYYWSVPESKSGYSGVATFSKVKPINVIYDIDNENHDGEGRAITCEYENFFLVNIYATNAGRGLPNLEKKRDWSEAFRKFMMKLDKKKPVIACGDFNCAHTEIDLENPKTNTKTAGFTPEEREDFTQLLNSGFFDSYRHLNPDKRKAYTFWSYMKSARDKDIGWRLDYFVLSNRLKKALVDNVINKDVMGSDHCPITLTIDI